MKKFWVESLQTSISELGFGAAGISGSSGGYSFGEVAESDAVNLIRQAIDCGINLFDTAPIYGFGASEERLGKAFKNSDDVFVVTKGGVDWHSTKRVNMSNDPKIIERMLHESLQRLKRDTIDLYMIHWPDPRVDIRAPLEILVKAQEQGKIKHIGLANTHREDLDKAREICSIDAFQCEFNLWQNQHFKSLKPFLEGRLFMGWGTFDKGILTGRVHEKRQYDKTDARAWAPWWNKKEVRKKVDYVAQFSARLSNYNMSMSDLSYWYTQIQSLPIQALVGIKTTSDLQDMVTRVERDFDRNLVLQLSTNFYQELPWKSQKSTAED